MTNTINPADCDRTTVYTGECRNFQDTEWITFNSGRRRSPNARDGNTWLIDVANGSFWMTDGQVRNLVRLVPARPITRNDLPSAIKSHRYGDLYFSRIQELEGYKDDVVEHLNANGGVPSTEVDRLRRAHEIVEGERDQARDSLRSLRGAYSRLTRDYRHLSDRAEAAEARTAITREDVEAALAQNHRMAFGAPVVSIEEAVEAVCHLFGVEAGQAVDPVEEKARELARAGGIDFDEQEPRGVEMLIGMARHVLGQEADR